MKASRTPAAGAAAIGSIQMLVGNPSSAGIPEDSFFRAIHYALNPWERFVVETTAGFLKPDNNIDAYASSVLPKASKTS